MIYTVFDEALSPVLAENLQSTLVLWLGSLKTTIILLVSLIYYSKALIYADFEPRAISVAKKTAVYLKVI